MAGIFEQIPMLPTEEEYQRDMLGLPPLEEPEFQHDSTEFAATDDFLAAMRGEEPVMEFAPEEVAREEVMEFAPDVVREDEMLFPPEEVGVAGEMQFAPDLIGSVAPEDAVVGQYEADMGGAEDLGQAAADAEFQSTVLGRAPVEFAAEPGDSQDISISGELTDSPLNPYIEEPALEDLNDDALEMRRWDQQQAKQAAFQQAQDNAFQASEIRREENESIFKEKTAKHVERVESILRDAIALGETDIDQNRWWSSRSQGQKMAAYGQAILGGQLGLLSGRGGNAGMDFLLGEIDKDISIQKANIQNKRAALGQQQGLVAHIYEATGDMHRAEETSRIAALHAEEQRARMDAAKLDPEGSQMMEREIHIRQIAAKREQHIAGLQAYATKESRIEAKMAIEERDQRNKDLETRAKLAELEAKRRKLNRRGSGRSRVKEPSISEKLSAKKEGLLWDAVNQQWVKEGGSDAGETMEEARLRKEIAYADKGELEISKDERSRKLGTRMKTTDGVEILAPDTKEAIGIQRAKGHLDTITSLIDDISIMREADGWSSDTLRSEDWQKMRSSFSQARLAMVGVYNLGVVAGPDLDLIDGILTTSDPSEVRGMVAGLQTARRGMVNRFNNEVSSMTPMGKKAARYEPKRKKAAKVRKMTSSDIVSLSADGVLLPHERELGESERGAIIDDWRKTVGIAVKRKSATVQEMRQIAVNIDSDVESGAITKKEGQAIVNQLGTAIAGIEKKRLGAKYKSTIQEMSVSELEEAQKNPGWARELRDAGNYHEPSIYFSPDDIYDYALGK